jgi:GT2 family glycosyltransferase
MPPTASVSVIVATLDRAESVRRVLKEILAQAPPDAEVVAVDQSSPGDRLALVEWAEAQGDPRLYVLDQTEPGLPAARNAGVAATTGSVLIFFDDDVTLEPGCISAHLAAYTDPTVGGVVGRIREQRLRNNAPSPTCRIGRDGRTWVGLDGDDPGEVDTVKGANMSFRRAALDDAGPFDEAYGGTALLEDADLSTRVRRAGWRLVYAPAAGVIHHHNPIGGVRIASAAETERWRFHNTGRFVARHRSAAAALPALATFSGIALERALRWGDPAAASRLVRAFVAGWAEGRRASPRPE